MAQRHRTRAVPAAAASAPTRTLIRGQRAEASFRLELDARPAYDFLISLVSGGDQEAELLPEDLRWLSGARDASGTLLGDAILFGAPARSKGIVTELSSLIVQRPAIRTADDLVASVDALSETELVETLLSDAFEHPELTTLLERTLAGDTAARSELRARWDELMPEHRIEDLLADPAAALARLRAGLRAWLEPFRQVQDRVARIELGDVERRRPDLAALPTDEFIERTTGGLRWLPEPRIRRVILAPSYFARPYNYLFSGPDWRLVCYPVADEAIGGADPLAPPAPLVRLHRALGDETRLRLLRLLVDRDWYLTELAQKLELSKPTVSHHLILLRTAGLVTVTTEGALTYYSLRRSRLEEAERDIQHYLGG